MAHLHVAEPLLLLLSTATNPRPCDMVEPGMVHGHGVLRSTVSDRCTAELSKTDMCMHENLVIIPWGQEYDLSATCQSPMHPLAAAQNCQLLSTPAVDMVHSGR